MKDSLVIECSCVDDRQHLIVAIGNDEFGKGFMKWFDDDLPDADSYYYNIDTEIFTQFEWGEYGLNKPEDLIGKSINIHDGLEVNLDYPEDEIKEIIQNKINKKSLVCTEHLIIFQKVLKSF